jgi:5-methylcytosine-specific restriction endonuclease McrA
MEVQMKSKFDDYTKDEMIEIINSSESIREVILKIGLCGNGQGSYTTFYKKMNEYDIDVSILKNKAKDKQKRILKENFLIKKDLDIVLTENSNYSRTHLKRRLLKEKILENKCCICGQLPMWNNKPLTLELDHINGINNDNRIENLRIICGHCHSQLPTTGSRRLKSKLKLVKKENKWHQKEEHNIEIVKKSNVDFSKFGWVKKVSELINKKPQKINKWMKKYLPDILKYAFKKHTQSGCGLSREASKTSAN